ncbi:MAG: inorganic diphosphatase [Adhaeribacter sp.]
MAPVVQNLPFLDAESGAYNVIIETPKGSRNKYTYDEQLQLYRLKGVLPAGASFPFDFGFLPGTHGEDGDPLDVLLLMDEPAYPGVLVPARLIGVIAAEQTEHGNTVRNDRLLAVSTISRTHQSLQDIKDVDKHLLTEIEHFFKSYNAIKGFDFEVIGRFGAKRAQALVAAGGKLFQKMQKEGG